MSELDMTSVKEQIEAKYSRNDYQIRIHEMGSSSGGSVKGHPDCD